MNKNISEANQQIDELLSSFFHAALPREFPPIQVSSLPSPVAAPMHDRHGYLSNSRAKISVAVSVALLLGGCWYLGGSMGKSTEKTTIGKGIDNAKLPKEIKKAIP